LFSLDIYAQVMSDKEDLKRFFTFNGQPNLSGLYYFTQQFSGFSHDVRLERPA